MKLIAITTGIALVASLVFGVALPDGMSVQVGDLLNGYTEGVMTFTGTINGIAHTGNGTAQQIFAGFKKLHPEAALSVETNMTTTLEARAAQNKIQPPNCCAPLPGPGPSDWSWANVRWINDGINYLNNLHGTCHVEARSCARISCSWNAAIRLCNDNEYSIDPNCGYLASYAQDIVNHCRRESLPHVYTCGQEFDTDNYNICVQGIPC
ncbi:hypothetical protein B0J14DRAFT_640603 [Halenospora varia]|nr:hypothetical protein B0J14DRAFT_640603 [Halenospora varia]